MRPYSLDLRQKAVAMYESLGSYNAVAKLLGVHHSWVKNMVTRLELTGSLADDCSSRGRKVKIDDRGRALLSSWLDEDNDLRLDDLLERLVEEGYDCCRATVANTLSAMKITRKKRPLSPKSKIVQTSRKSGSAGSRK